MLLSIHKPCGFFLERKRWNINEDLALQEEVSGGSWLVFIEQACFHLPILQVTAQCPLIGWDCQAAVRLIAWKPPAIRQKPFFLVLERQRDHVAELFDKRTPQTYH